MNNFTIFFNFYLDILKITTVLPLQNISKLLEFSIVKDKDLNIEIIPFLF